MPDPVPYLVVVTRPAITGGRVVRIVPMSAQTLGGAISSVRNVYRDSGALYASGIDFSAHPSHAELARSAGIPIYSPTPGDVLHQT